MDLACCFVITIDRTCAETFTAFQILSLSFENRRHIRETPFLLGRLRNKKKVIFLFVDISFIYYLERL